MIGQDLHNTLRYTLGIAPAANANLGTTALTSAIIDCADARATEFVIITGTLSDADAVYSVLLEEGDNSALSDNAAVADADMLPAGTGQEAAAGFTFANDSVVRTIGYVGIKRYVRLTITPTTTADSGNTPIAVLVVQKPRARANVLGS